MQRINDDIKNGTFQRVYLLYGEERYLRRQYRDKLKAAMCGDGDEMNTHYYEGKDVPVGEIIDLAETLPFLADRRVTVSYTHLDVYKRQPLSLPAVGTERKKFPLTGYWLPCRKQCRRQSLF